MKPIRFCLKIGVPHKSQLKNWGDYFFAKSLGEELEREGHQYYIQLLPDWHTDKDMDADVVIHFRGLSKYNVKSHHFNIMWNISHPKDISVQEYNSYDLILTASHSYSLELANRISVPVYPLLQFVDTNYFYPDFTSEHKSEILFVGNSRRVMRPIVADILPPPKSLSVYGSDWEDLISYKYIKGKWFPNEELRKLYSSCDILLNDHWQDMKDYGLINNRFYDAVACKTIVINDDHPELSHLFPKALIYRNREELLSLINDIDSRPDYYRDITESLFHQVITEHTVSVRVKHLLQILSQFEIRKDVVKIKTKKSLKKKINEALLTQFGYGRTYKGIHKGYSITKEMISKINGFNKKVRHRIYKIDSRKNLINVTSEAEIKAFANRLAVPYKNTGRSPLVSIIIPTKDGLQYLKQLFPYLFTNTLYQKYEVIIVDNDSKDGTVGFINRITDNRIKYFNTKSNLNFSQSINFGVKQSTGQLIVLLNNDVMPLYGWLDELLNSYNNLDKCGIVGSRLIYNELDITKRYGEVIYPGCTVQHDGIRFRWSHFGIEPYNSGKHENPIVPSVKPYIEEVPAVTAACLLTDRVTFMSVNGFDENYYFGKEDVDFSLRVCETGKKVYVNRKSLLFHREFSSQVKVKRSTRKDWRIKNHNYFNEKWGEKLEKAIWEEKILNISSYWSEKPIHIAFLVTENTPDTTAGDLFSAQGLGNSLKQRYQYEVSYIPRRPVFEWGTIPDSVDILFSMRHDFDIRQIHVNRSTIKIAWIRGYIEEWLNKPWIHGYDAIIASSEIGLHAAQKVVDANKCWGVVPLGITEEFLSMSERREASQRDIDVSFVGNIFQVPRDIVTHLDLGAGFEFHFYGLLQAQKNHPWTKFSKGPLIHSEVPNIYSRSKIVIEDTAPFNKGTVNLRIYEAAACGALVICNESPGIEEIFGESIIIYKNKDDLTNKIRYYLEHEDERFSKAEALKNMVFNQHTFLHRAEQFKDILYKNLLKLEGGIQ